jgi:hypothetical protein
MFTTSSRCVPAVAETTALKPHQLLLLLLLGRRRRFHASTNVQTLSITDLNGRLLHAAGRVRVPPLETS